jgi:hypothetical protein
MLLTFLSFPPAIYDMKEGQDRMTTNHAGAGIPHNLPDPLAQMRLVTMHRTSGAGRFIFPEKTFFKTLEGILLKFKAAGANIILGPMQIPTIDTDHCRERIYFPCDSQSMSLSAGSMQSISHSFKLQGDFGSLRQSHSYHPVSRL